jgi:hypothetical protein
MTSRFKQAEGEGAKAPSFFFSAEGVHDMQNPLRDRLESAALRLDDFLDAAPALGHRENILLSAARDIAQAIEMVNND